MTETERVDGKRTAIGASALGGYALAFSVALLLGCLSILWTRSSEEGVPYAQSAIAAQPRTRLGINLFGVAPFNRQQVFTNLISQSEWFSSSGEGWSVMPAERLDRLGWVRFLKPGETAPRPLTLPPAPFRTTEVRCIYKGTGLLSAGGAASVVARHAGLIILSLAVTGKADEGAWIELVRTDADNPVRDIDCRETSRPREERFHPEFLESLQDFQVLRFLDWQRVNDNLAVAWSTRALPTGSSQAGPAGVSIEDMVDLANRTRTDPWFLMPYRADAAYVRAFATLVREKLAPERIVHVELGNEIWNDMFDAALQARREGLTLQLGGGNPHRAQALRYAQKLRQTMRIWTEVFADQPTRLVRVAASQNANPDLAKTILAHSDTSRWVDALATAPYVWLDLSGQGPADIETVFAQMPRAIDDAIEFAARNQAIATRHGKRYIAYEGGQHLVTPDVGFARLLQRDPRMGGVYRAYLRRWDMRIRSDLILYASTAPISQYGSWGLREYAGQPLTETPKLAAVRQFVAERH